MWCHHCRCCCNCVGEPATMIGKWQWCSETCVPMSSTLQEQDRTSLHMSAMNQPPCSPRNSCFRIPLLHSNTATLHAGLRDACLLPAPPFVPVICMLALTNTLSTQTTTSIADTPSRYLHIITRYHNSIIRISHEHPTVSPIYDPGITRVSFPKLKQCVF